MAVLLFKRCIATAVVLIAGSIAQGFATESSPEQWRQAFPLSTLQGGANNALPVKPDLSRSLSYRETGASAEQVDPLSKTATIRFGPEVVTVEEAANMILDPVGYELLAQGPNVSLLLEELLDSPLPINQREFVHLRVSEMLRALAGVGHVVVFDHVHRKTTFDPIPRYHRIGQATQPDLGTYRKIDSGPSLSPRPSIVVTPLGESTSLRQRLGPADTDFSSWQVIDGVVSLSGDDDSFSEQVSRALQGNEFIRPLATISASGLIDAHIVHAEVDATRLAVATERTLRRIASQFHSDKHDVVISDCSTDVPAQAQAFHQTLIRSALVRLGVDKAHHQTIACSDSGASVVSDGKITHLVALSVTSSLSEF